MNGAQKCSTTAAKITIPKDTPARTTTAFRTLKNLESVGLYKVTPREKKIAAREPLR